MFDVATFIEDCRAAVKADSSHTAVQGIMERAFADPHAIVQALGEPSEGGIYSLYRSPELTIINVVWKPGFITFPHNHTLWAMIGIYLGREDNIFWRRLKDDPNHHRIEAAGAKSLSEGDVLPLGKDIIHSVVNPLPRYSGAIHVYGGDFFAINRSEWDPEHLTERPYDLDKALKMFAE